MTLDDITLQEREDWLTDRGFNPEAMPWGKNTHSSEGYRAPIETMEPTYNYITHELGLDVKVFDKFPQLFGLSVEDNLIPKVAYITQELGLDVKVFEKNPSLFGSSIDGNLKPKVEYVTQELGLDVKVFEKKPSLFNYSIEDNLRPKVDYITKELGLDVKVFEKNPSLFGSSIDGNLKPKVEYVTQELGLDVKVFEKLPSLFNYSIEDNLKPKYHYLTTEMRADNSALEKFPAAFGLSLRNRIIPRWEFAKHKGQTNLSLSYLLVPNDSKFAERLGSDAATYHTFRDENKDFIEETYQSLLSNVAGDKMTPSDAYKRFFDNLNNHMYNHVDATDRIEFNKQRGERLLKEYSEPLYERFLEQSDKWKDTVEGQQLTGLVEFFGSMRNSSVVRKGIENLISQLEIRAKVK